MRKQNFEPLKMNLQLFAKEPENEPSEGKAGSEPDNELGDGEGDGEHEDDPEEDVPNLAEENAALKVQLAKMKKAMDKATSDTAKYKKQFGTKAKMLSYEEVSEMIGHEVGGVCPFAVKEGVKVLLYPLRL